jgi:hypothetical protein
MERKQMAQRTLKAIADTTIRGSLQRDSSRRLA